MAEKPTKVYYIPGRFVHERLEDHEVESVAEANRLVATGAFALTKKEANEAAFTTPEAVEIREESEAPTPEPAPPASEE